MPLASDSDRVKVQNLKTELEVEGFKFQLLQYDDDPISWLPPAALFLKYYIYTYWNSITANVTNWVMQGELHKLYSNNNNNKMN